MNQYLQLFLKRVSNSDKIPISARNQGIFKHVTKICKLLHMNELEITVWSLYLEQLEWSIERLGVEMFLVVSAMQAKDYLNDGLELQMYLKKTNEEYPDFNYEYEEWINKREHRISFGIKEINKQYNKYRLVCFNINYNLAFDYEFYVRA